MTDDHEGDPLVNAAAEPRGGPAVRRIQAGAELRRLREAGGVTREAAAAAIRGSEAKMSRLEAGRVGFKQRDVADLLTLYGTDEPARDLMVRLADQANETAWWHSYHDSISPGASTYIGLEQAATLIRSYDSHYVPSLLQTAAYAEAVVSLGQTLRDDEVRRRVELRMRRQQLFDDPRPPEYWAVIDEAVLHRNPGGGRQVMRDQLDHLLQASERPNITIQVVPFDSDVAVSNPFTLLRFAEPDLPDVAYTELLTTAHHVTKDHEVRTYLKAMDRLAARASTPRQSIDLITSVRDAL